MRMLLRGLAAATALSLAPLAAATVTAAPAHAAATVNTTITLDVSKTKGFYGDYFSLTADVTTTNDPDGYDSPFVGSSFLQVLTPGAKTWRNVGRDDSPGYSYFPDFDTFRGNLFVRVAYTGGVYSPGESNERTYPASVSRPLKISTARNMDIKDLPGRNAKLRIAVKPQFGKKKLIIQTKKGGKFRTTGRLKTNKKGVAIKVFAGSRRGIKYRVIAKGDRNFIASSSTFKVTRSSF